MKTATSYSDADDAPGKTPPSSKNVEATNTGDCPSFFSNFI
ncbi:hypothetical protein HanIR_Chr02g0072661 [Helianthus annuus]|nr:hypothetical protein HanIR_Chr02g0072661 [Helianthus annuus]